jgi:oxygen-independent coproporphyrinogen-3 oxidase
MRGATQAQFDHPLGLYIHIPFCEKKCAYCDFNTYAGLQADFDVTVDALCGEMARWCALLQGRTISTIFVGGGTPTVLSMPQLTRLFAAIHQNFTVAPRAEITCEANPGTVDREKFGLLRALGVNRLSLGVQSFQTEELHFLSRIHSVEDVFRAFDAARRAGFANINLDFIFGLPNQPLHHWQATLEQAIQLQPEHLSLYSLIVEPNTPLYHWVETGQAAAPDEDQAAEHFEFAMARLAAAGFRHYEVSNWARETTDDLPDATPRLASQHNLLYWRNQEYLGIGPGAHSHLQRSSADGTLLDQRWGNRKPVAGYIKRVTRGDPLEEFVESIDRRMAMGETMMLGLRLLQEGVAYARFQAQHNVALPIVFATELAKLHKQKLIEYNERIVRLTPQGLLLGNQVFAEFLPTT